MPELRNVTSNLSFMENIHIPLFNKSYDKAK